MQIMFVLVECNALWGEREVHEQTNLSGYISQVWQWEDCIEGLNEQLHSYI